MPQNNEALVFVDLETTGANFANDRIIEIGLVLVDHAGVREWSSLVNPQQSVSAFITGLTGIDDTMLVDAPSFAQLASSVREMLRGRLFVAHNARFDYGFLKAEFGRIGIDFRSTSLCTVKLSRKLFPEHHRHNLDTLVARYQISTAERHRALADARILWQLWQRWLDLLPLPTLLQAVAAISGRPELPPQLAQGALDDLPEVPGAYACFDQNGQPLQIKQARNLRQEIFALFAPSRRDSSLVVNTWRVEWRESAGEFGARLGELALSAGQHKKPDELYSWQLFESAPGDYRPRLVCTAEVDFSASEELFGLYGSQREALNALRKLAEAHRLCHAQLGLGVADKSGKGAKDAKKDGCIGYRQKTCRGLCVGKENLSVHNARLMTAFAKFRLKPWPFSGSAGIVEKDAFGMREDFHLFDRWRYYGVVTSEASLTALLESISTCPPKPFDADIYRILNKALLSGKVTARPL